MMVWAMLAYLLAGVYTTRYTVSALLHGNYTDMDADDIFMAILTFVGTVLFWPIAAVFLVIKGTCRAIGNSPVGPVIRWRIKRFYTLDKTEQKILAQQRPSKKAA